MDYFEREHLGGVLTNLAKLEDEADQIAGGKS